MKSNQIKLLDEKTLNMQKKLTKLLKHQINIQKLQKPNSLPIDFLEKFICSVSSNSFNIGTMPFFSNNKICEHIFYGDIVLTPYSQLLFFLLSIPTPHWDLTGVYRNQNKVEVYQDINSNQVYVQKQIKENDESDTKYLFREIINNMSLTHPFINPCFSFNTLECTFVSPFQACGSLLHLIQYQQKNSDHHHFYLKDKFRILAQVSYALEYIHTLGMIHRDVKPDNILIDYNWNAKLADFGLSRFDTTSQQKTKVGTPIYLAFEILKSQTGKNAKISYTNRVDTHSLMATAIHLFTLGIPYKTIADCSIVVFLDKALHLDPYSIKDLNISPKAIEWMYKAFNQQETDFDMPKFRQFLKDIASEIDNLVELVINKKDLTNLKDTLINKSFNKPRNLNFSYKHFANNENIKTLCENNKMVDDLFHEWDLELQTNSNYKPQKLTDLLEQLEKNNEGYRKDTNKLQLYQQAMKGLKSNTFKQLERIQNFRQIIRSKMDDTELDHFYLTIYKFHQKNIICQISPFNMIRKRDSSNTSSIYLNTLTAYATTLCQEIKDGEYQIVNIINQSDPDLLEIGQYYITQNSVSSLSYEYGMQTQKDEIVKRFSFQAEKEYYFKSNQLINEIIEIREVLAADLCIAESFNLNHPKILLRKNTPLDATAIYVTTGYDLHLLFDGEQIGII